MNPEHLQDKAEKYFVRGKWPKALASFLRLSELKPTDLRVRIKIAETLLRLERPQEAQIILRQVADLYTKDGQLHKAISVHHRLIELNRDDKELQAKLAILYEKQQAGAKSTLPTDPSEVEKGVREIANEDALQKIEALVRGLEQARARSQWREALEKAVALWRLNPVDPDTRLQIGQILEAMKRPEDAAGVYASVARYWIQKAEILRAVYLLAKIFHLSARTRQKAQGQHQDLLRQVTLIFQKQQEKFPETSRRENSFLQRLRPRSEIMEETLQEILLEPIDLGKVKRVPLLSDLPRKAGEALMQFMQPVTVAKGKRIFEKGETADCLYLITHGEVGLFLDKGGDLPLKHAPTKTLEETELLGTFGFFFDEKRHQSAFALTEVEMLQVTKLDLELLRKEYPEIHQALDQLYRKAILAPLLQIHPIFQTLKDPERVEVTRAFTALPEIEGNFEIREGETRDAIYYLKEGMLHVYCGKALGREPLYPLGPGNFFGEIECLTGSVFSQAYRASGPIRLFALKVSDLADSVQKELVKKDHLREWLKIRHLLALPVHSQIATEPWQGIAQQMGLS